MAGHSADPPEAANYTGLKKIFNSETFRGRANVGMATYAVVGLTIAFFTLKPKSKKK